ncbi:hypothetical protein RclHR1_05170005 [Rhizophagus clarus]|uniref:Reelin domain-containing protein n=1 Tax=Rhizophagus clarus TaxID=94130 RepID=A0A2Z6RYM1_9GLOM|nr:hypothetical protein RclHR1_05170005 [Rhizophagus clarus]
MVKLLAFVLLIHIVVFSSLSYSATVFQDNSLSRRDTTIDPNKCIGFASNLPRSVTIVLINQSGYNITYSQVDFKDGRWITQADTGNTITCDPSTYPPLPNGQSETFSTANSRTAFGTEGTVFFGIGDQMAPPSTFSIYWLNPEIGVNNYIVTISNTSLYSYHNLDPGEGNNAVYQVIISAIPSA